MTDLSARAIDFNHLDTYTAGDQSLIREVLRLFKGQIGPMIELMRASADAKVWRETAHGIKGAARGIGAWETADAASTVEKADPADGNGSRVALDRLAYAFSKVEAEIDSELAKAA